MIATKLYVRAFKSIYEMEIPFDGRMNVIIGANESGKTNILRALHSFLPEVPFDTSLTCQYSNHYYMGKCPEVTLEFSGLTKENRNQLLQISEVFKDIESFQVRRDGPSLKDYHLLIGDSEVDNIDVRNFIKLLPKVLYFSDISLLKNRVDYESLVSNHPEYNTERNLLKIGAIEDYEIIFEDSTRGRRAMDEASRIITEQIRRAWSQEPSIEIKLSVNGSTLYIDFSDDTTVFDTPESRSLGFRWYLSFYVNFVAQTFEARANEYIFLVDEPGIHLHPGGQKDLVNVLEDLSLKNQLIYTTHSPFMINKQNPERVFLAVKDKNGTRVDTKAYRDNWKTLRKEIDILPGDLFFFTAPTVNNDSADKKRAGLLHKLK
ncbi:AAA family ATPase [candidate division KSB1 bacterium]|nr:AAA family ATPase [candidate division KSB1 bacterium]